MEVDALEPYSDLLDFGHALVDLLIGFEFVAKFIGELRQLFVLRHVLFDADPPQNFHLRRVLFNLPEFLHGICGSHLNALFSGVYQGNDIFYRMRVYDVTHICAFVQRQLYFSIAGAIQAHFSSNNIPDDLFIRIHLDRVTQFDPGEVLLPCFELAPDFRRVVDQNT